MTHTSASHFLLHVVLLLDGERLPLSRRANADATVNARESERAKVLTRTPLLNESRVVVCSRALRSLCIDDIYEYGSGLPVLTDEAIADPKCMRLAMSLLHRAMALVAHLPGKVVCSFVHSFISVLIFARVE